MYGRSGFAYLGYADPGVFVGIICIAEEKAIKFTRALIFYILVVTVAEWFVTILELHEKKWNTTYW
jgi:hypothetical protein